MNIGISHINLGDDATLTYSTQHPTWPASNVQHRWFVKPWRSLYETDSGWGLFRITNANNDLSFTEGGGTLWAALTAGDYDADTLCAEIKIQMDAAGALTYTVTYDDATNLFTIAATGPFVIELSNPAQNGWAVLGWDAIVDTASLASHTAPAIRIHTQEELRFNLGAVKDFDLITIKNHNLQATATIEIRYYSDAWVTLVDTDVVAWNADLMALIVNRSYRYVMVYIEDVDNPDGYVEIGRVWIGEMFKPRIGFSIERSKIRNDPSVIAESENGQASSIQREHFDTWNYLFEGVDPDDADDMDAIFDEVGTSMAFFICEDPDAADITPSTKYLSMISWESEHIAGEWWSINIEVKEER